MARKAVEVGGKREEIINEARKMFFEKGFDGMTIRELQRAVGCEVGLFYYYFKSKDEVFEVVVDNLAKEWAETFSQAVENEKESTRANIEKTFEVLCNLGTEYAKKNLHWSVKSALCDRMAVEALPFVEEGLESSTLAMAVTYAVAKLAFGDDSLRDKDGKIKELLDAFVPEEETKGREETNRRDISVVLL